MACVRVRITGRVQGVWFRDSTQKEAVRLGVSGWVRNTGDGAVEGEFHGGEEALRLLVAWCQHGPPTARVAGVEVTACAGDEAMKGFEIRY